MKNSNGQNGTHERPRLAAIDVGTNSIRLVVAEVEPDGGYRVLDEERSMTRLGSGLDKRGALSRESMLRSIEALAKMKAIADGFRVGQLRAIATSAVREASNGSEFRAEVKRRCGMNVEVISAAEEGRLALQSAARHFALDGRPTAVVDIGGGSLEVVLSGGALIEQMHSLALGAVRLTERFARSDPWRRAERKALIREIDEVIKAQLGKPLLRPEVMVGSGGTFTTLAQMVRLQREGQEGRVHGYVITRTEIEEWLGRLFATPLAQRRQIPGLNPQRADIIVAGAAAIVRLARKLRVQQILINEGGVRDGMMFAMIARLHGSAGGTPRAAHGREAWVRSFARKCRSHEAHCEHVTRLALQMFDALRGPFNLPDEAREMLQAGALLHDIGYLIGHAKHHKHAYHLIMHSEMPGFTGRELEIVANVARYHRRALPKKSHAEFRRLSGTDRRLVCLLAGILRVADALDRTHNQCVREVRVLRRGEAVRLQLTAQADPQVEMWYARRKGRLFEKAFGTRLSFAVARAESRRELRVVRAAAGGGTRA